MKRESGENPEQTRCCKLYTKVFEQYSIPLFSNEWEGRFKDGVSQKTCQD